MVKTIETMDILGKIKEVTNNKEEKLNNIYLRTKNSKTDEIKGIRCNYVADEILFLFESDNINKSSLGDYLHRLEIESWDNCWDSYVSVPEGYTHPNEIPDDAIDCLTLDDEDMADGRYDVVINLDTRIYTGSHDDCPIAKYDESFDIKDIEVTEEAIVLVY